METTSIVEKNLKRLEMTKEEAIARLVELGILKPESRDE